MKTKYFLDSCGKVKKFFIPNVTAIKKIQCEIIEGYKY